MKSDEKIPSPSSKAVSVRETDDEFRRLLEKLDREPRPDQAALRRHERHVYRRSILVELRQPSGNALVLKAPTRDISAEGISFLHHGYVPRGTECHIQLVTIRNRWVEMDGVVAGCDYIESGIHVVGVKLARHIDITSFAAPSAPRRILVVNDDPQISKLVSLQLSTMNAGVDVVHDGEQALSAVDKTAFDVILMDVEMPALDGVETTRRLRDNGYGGCIVAMTAQAGPGDAERLLESGFNHYLAKPFTRDRLASLLETLSEGPLYSTLAGIENMVELIDQFVDDLAGRMAAIEQAAAEKNLPDLVKLARILKGEAGSYGFESISQVAQEVETLASGAAQFAQLHRCLLELTKRCRLARKSGA
jgi:CheY-like chemotaxis protein